MNHGSTNRPRNSSSTPAPVQDRYSAGEGGCPTEKWTLRMCVLLFCLTAGVFLPTLRNGFVNFDDGFVIDNPHVTSGLRWENLKWAFQNGYAGSHCQPLTWLSHMADCQFFGLNPWGHHLTSVALHALNTALLFLFLAGMTGSPWRSLIAAALFGLHPLRVESVGWVAERKDVLYVFWAILSLWAYVKSVRMIAGLIWRKRFFYFLAMFFLACGLMSKAMLVTLPFVFLLLDIWPLNRWRLGRDKMMENWHLLIEKIPFFGLALAAAVGVYSVRTGAVLNDAMTSLSFTARLSNAFVAYWRYGFKSFWPSDLAVYYPHPGHWPLPFVILVAGALLLVSALVIVRVRSQPWNFVGWFWFVGALVPVIGLVPMGTHSIADRYTYFPMIGLWIGTVWSVADAAQRWGLPRPALAAGAAAALLACAALTLQQISYWKDSESLFRHTIAVTRNNPLAHMNLGVVLLAKDRPAEAAVELRKALSMIPDYSNAHMNLGAALQRMGLVGEAVEHYRKGLESKPRDANAHFLLGTALAQAGQLEEAIQQFQTAIQLKPDAFVIYNNLGSALRRQGKRMEAIAQFQTALRIKPDYADAWNNLGVSLASAGKFEEAAAQFREAVRLQPDLVEAYFNLGLALEYLKRTDEAVSQYREALRRKPDYTAAQRNLEAALKKAP